MHRAVVVTHQRLGVGQRADDTVIVRISDQLGPELVEPWAHQGDGAVALPEDTERLSVLHRRVGVAEVDVGALPVTQFDVCLGVADLVVIPVEFGRDNFRVLLLFRGEPGEQRLHFLPGAAGVKGQQSQSRRRVEGVRLQFHQQPDILGGLRILPQVHECIVAGPKHDGIARIERLGATEIAHRFGPDAFVARQGAERN